jgi:ABC-type Fe3+-hydroxamate transport system substrate-binding protein
MPIYQDQLGRQVALPGIPERIISLVPSQTELLFYLGLDESVIGITKFCVHPVDWFRNKTRIGGTKKLDIEKIRSLKPDLIIANKEENLKEEIEALAALFPVWISDIAKMADSYEMIRTVGAITGKQSKALSLVQEIEKGIGELVQERQEKNHCIKTAYLIWKDPYMSIGGDTFIHEMMQLAGFENVLGDQNRYPVADIEMLRKQDTALLLLSSEPYPFREKHIAEFAKLLPGCRILLADGEIFSWYGSRLLYAPGYIRSLWKQLDK